MTSAVRQSEVNDWTFGEPSEVMQSSAIHTVFLSGDLRELCIGSLSCVPAHGQYCQDGEYLSSRTHECKKHPSRSDSSFSLEGHLQCLSW